MKVARAALGGGKGRKLLELMLRGVHVDPPIAFQVLNLPTVHARAAEMRKKGWPVRTEYLPHPSLPGEDYVVYFFDDHFLRWCQSFNDMEVDPILYHSNDGRGRFKVVEGGKRA